MVISWNFGYIMIATTIKICNRYLWLVDVCAKLSKDKGHLCSLLASASKHKVRHNYPSVGKGRKYNPTISEVLTGSRTFVNEP